MPFTELVIPSGQAGSAAQAGGDRPAVVGTALEPASTADRLHQIRVPTLWLQARCQRMAAQLTQVQTEILPGTAHLPNLEQPGRFNHALLRLLAALPPS